MQRKTMKTINSPAPSQSQWNYFLSHIITIKIRFWITIYIIEQDSKLISNKVPSKCFVVTSYGYLGNIKNPNLDSTVKDTHTKRNFLNQKTWDQCPEVILYCRKKQLNTFARLECLCLASAIKICDKLIERKSQGNKIIQSSKQCYRWLVLSQDKSFPLFS